MPTVKLFTEAWFTPHEMSYRILLRDLLGLHAQDVAASPSEKAAAHLSVTAGNVAREQIPQAESCFPYPPSTIPHPGSPSQAGLQGRGLQGLKSILSCSKPLPKQT